MNITVTLIPGNGRSAAVYAAETACGHYCEGYADQFTSEADFAEWALIGFCNIEDAWAALEANNNNH
jgi:hypothetical protein